MDALSTRVPPNSHPQNTCSEHFYLIKKKADFGLNKYVYMFH